MVAFHTKSKQIYMFEQGKEDEKETAHGGSQQMRSVKQKRYQRDIKIKWTNDMYIILL